MSVLAKLKTLEKKQNFVAKSEILLQPALAATIPRANRLANLRECGSIDKLVQSNLDIYTL